ncbi:hypothetical protein DAPPUDRAFT_304705 [Daphnia pulex]|uniref:Granulins domain-containing protein n=1 Tax=Daphnia pulex TaxID=6669 RepID=E9FVX7_DAPPU|nr:hypothetical protein DAPPUDRAFT_304705 [Daphnia pulex]|eukprot:EFX89024.1 hypothetical protein DAPPUDRAFT_304705 [Daphnia pulex]
MRCVISLLVAMFLIVIVRSQNNEYSVGDIYRKSENFTTGKDRIDCPGDKKQTCADGYTCCESPSGDYACCPHLNAVCCEDHIHCCPQGSSCDVGRCKKDKKDNNNLIDMYGYPIFTIDDMMNSLERISRSVCPGDEFQCPLQTTCCKLSGGKLYGCCPFEEGVCCSDELHCCPKGFECTPEETCVHSSNSTIPISTIN